MVYYCISTIVQREEGSRVAWNFNQREAVFVQIANRIRLDIVNGKYLPDEQIPSVRQLAYEAAVNPNTMQKALSHLEEEGLLHTHGTVGRFVSSDPNMIEAAKEHLRRAAVREWIAQAKELGLSVEEMA